MTAPGPRCLTEPVPPPNADATNATSSSASVNAPDDIQEMLAIRFAGTRTELALLPGTCGTAYMDIHSVKRVMSVCQTLGLQINHARHAIYEDMDISWGDVKRFFNIKSGFKNAVTLHTSAVKAQQHLEVQQRGSLSVDNTLLLRQLNYMLSEASVGSNHLDPVAAQVLQLPRVPFKRSIDRVGASA